MDLKYFICVLGLVLVIEGLPYFALPGRMKEWMRRIMEVPEQNLRAAGLAAMALGLFLVWLGRG